MSPINTRREATRRFHLALSFVRWREPDGKPRKAPLTSDQILRMMLTRNSYDRPSQRDEMKDAIFHDDLLESRATTLLNKLRKNASLPQDLVDMFGKNKWSSDQRAKNSEAIEQHYQEHYPDVYGDYMTWRASPSEYLMHVDGYGLEMAAASTSLGGTKPDGKPGFGKKPETERGPF